VEIQPSGVANYSGGDAVDQAMQDSVVDLSAKIGTGSRLRKIEWAKNLFPPDLPVYIGRRRMRLNIKLKDKLDSEVWKPLLAAALVYDAKLRRRRRATSLLYLIPSTLVLILYGWYTLFFVAPRLPPQDITCLRCSPLAASFPLVAFAVFLLFSMIVSPYIRRLAFQADKNNEPRTRDGVGTSGRLKED